MLTYLSVILFVIVSCYFFQKYQRHRIGIIERRTARYFVEWTEFLFSNIDACVSIEQYHAIEKLIDLYRAFYADVVPEPDMKDIIDSMMKRMTRRYEIIIQIDD